MARLESTSIFRMEGLEVRDLERRAWEIFEGPRAIRIDRSKPPLTETQSRDEKLKRFDAISKLDLSNDPIKFYWRALLGFVFVYHLQREHWDIALNALSGDRDARQNYRERWKRELLDEQLAPTLIQITTPATNRVSDVVERAELIREVNRSHKLLLDLEKQIAAIGRRIDFLEINSLTAETLETLADTIEHATKEAEKKERVKRDAVLSTFEQDVISGTMFRKNGEKGREERNRAFKDTMEDLLMIFGALRIKPEHKNQSDRQLFPKAREEYGKRHELKAEEIKKLPKANAFYTWLRAEKRKVSGVALGAGNVRRWIVHPGGTPRANPSDS